MSVIQMAFGDIEYQDMEDNNPVFGPILFILFAFFVGIVLMVIYWLSSVSL